MKRIRPSLLLAVLCGSTLLGTLMLPSGARTERTAPLLLESEFGELCTMCMGYLRCSPQGSEAHETYDLYYLGKRGFWAQLGTLWDWSAQLFGARPPAHERPLVIYRQRHEAGSIVRSVTADQKVRLSLETARIELPQSWVDRRNGDWFDAMDRHVGHCERVLPAQGQSIEEQFR